jgi:hypothetical protein
VAKLHRFGSGIWKPHAFWGLQARFLTPKEPFKSSHKTDAGVMTESGVKMDSAFFEITSVSTEADVSSSNDAATVTEYSSAVRVLEAEEKQKAKVSNTEKTNVEVKRMPERSNVAVETCPQISLNILESTGRSNNDGRLSWDSVAKPLEVTQNENATSIYTRDELVGHVSKGLWLRKRPNHRMARQRHPQGLTRYVWLNPWLKTIYWSKSIPTLSEKRTIEKSGKFYISVVVNDIPFHFSFHILP